MSSVQVDFFDRLSQLMSDYCYNQYDEALLEDEVALSKIGGDISVEYNSRRLFGVTTNWAKKPLIEKKLRKLRGEYQAYQHLEKKGHVLNPILIRQFKSRITDFERELEGAKKLDEKYQRDLTEAMDDFGMFQLLGDLRSGNLTLVPFPKEVDMNKFQKGDHQEESRVRQLFNAASDKYVRDSGKSRSQLLAYWLSFYGVTVAFLEDIYMELSSFAQDFVPDYEGHVKNFKALATSHKAEEFERDQNIQRLVEQQFRKSQERFDYDGILNFTPSANEKRLEKDGFLYQMNNLAPHFRQLTSYMTLIKVLLEALKGQHYDLPSLLVTNEHDRRDRITIMVLDSLFKQGYINLYRDKTLNDDEDKSTFVDEASVSIAPFVDPTIGVTRKPDPQTATPLRGRRDSLIVGGSSTCESSPMVQESRRRRRQSVIQLKPRALFRDESVLDPNAASIKNDLKCVEAYLKHKLKQYNGESKDHHILSEKLKVVGQFSQSVNRGTQDLYSALTHLLHDNYDILNKKRNKWDCFHKKTRTIRILEAIRQHDGEALKKLLPKKVRNDFQIEGITLHT